MTNPAKTFRLLAISLATFSASASAQRPIAKLPAVPTGSTYVAMGSSFAAGPNITIPADASPNRCERSRDNYAHQLARKRNLRLIDVSCGGATTSHILGQWRELPPQIDSITPNTRLVTITIGGNDLGFAGGLMVGSCENVSGPASDGAAAMCEIMKGYATKNPQMAAAMETAPDDAAFAKVKDALNTIAVEVRRRAPQARLIFVDYITIVPDNGSCPSAPLSKPAAARARATAERLARLTEEAARIAGAGLVKASALSRGHDACARNSWATGFVRPKGVANFTPYHPKLEAMTAIATELDRQLGR